MPTIEELNSMTEVETQRYMHNRFRERDKTGFFKTVERITVKDGDRIMLIEPELWCACPDGVPFIPAGSIGTVVYPEPQPEKPWISSMPYIVWDNPKYAAREGFVYGCPSYDIVLLDK